MSTTASNQTALCAIKKEISNELVKKYPRHDCWLNVQEPCSRQPPESGLPLQMFRLRQKIQASTGTRYLFPYTYYNGRPGIEAANVQSFGMFVQTLSPGHIKEHVFLHNFTS